MPALLLSKATENEFIDRIQKITPESERLWGELSHAAMMRHLRHVIEMSLGHAEAKDQSNIIGRTVVKFLFFHIITSWPRGKIKAPPNFTPQAQGDFDAEKELLIQRVREFVDTADKEPNRIGISPFFGPNPLSYWQRIHGVHTNHHLVQFGV